ncbi:MAG: hypothetical protein KKB70_02600 [Proteobacteria bacterium]|nr:hypothetical protein [Pseudomonadota bacterium]
MIRKHNMIELPLPLLLDLINNSPPEIKKEAIDHLRARAEDDPFYLYRGLVLDNEGNLTFCEELADETVYQNKMATRIQAFEKDMEEAIDQAQLYLLFEQKAKDHGQQSILSPGHRQLASLHSETKKAIDDGHAKIANLLGRLKRLQSLTPEEIKKLE